MSKYTQRSNFKSLISSKVFNKNCNAKNVMVYQTNSDTFQYLKLQNFCSNDQICTNMILQNL